MLMAEMVSSAVIQETVSQILSGLVQKYEEKDESNVNRNLERLEMAHIRLEVALDISDKWQVTDASLLRWRKKLKRAAQECDDTLHKCKQRIVEGEQMEQEVRKSSFRTRVAHATKSFISGAFHGKNELSGSIVQRFEWYADGARDFLRFMELEWYADGARDFLRFMDLGGTPRHIMPFNPLIRNLFTGKRLQQKISLGNECTFFLLWIPFSATEHGIEASLFFLQKDGNAPENNFYFSVMLQLSESTDIVGIAVNCLQLFTPLFKPTVEIIRNRLMLLPTQDFRWAPHVDSQQKEHWDNLHRFCTQWFRPDPLCCKQLDQHELCCSRKTDMSKLPDVSLQSVIEVNLQCYVSLPVSKIPPLGTRYLIAGLHFMPHGSSKVQLLADKSSAIAVTESKGQQCLHTDITLEQLEKVMLQKAIYHFQWNAKAGIYQMLWKSEHNTAYIQVEKANTKMQRTGKLIWRSGKGKISCEQVQTYVLPHFLNMWVAQAPLLLQGLIRRWVLKEATEIVNHDAAWINYRREQ